MTLSFDEEPNESYRLNVSLEYANTKAWLISPIIESSDGLADC